MDSPQILIVNGPNLNLLGRREPQTYGTDTLATLEARVRGVAEELGCRVDFRQHNHEGVLVDWIHEAGERHDGLVLNPGALTHYSYAIRDAVAAIVPTPVVEVHLSNVHAREPFRHYSVVSAVAAGIVIGWGALGYELALRGLVSRLRFAASSD